MENITDIDKKRLLEFVNENDLDYTPIDNGIFKFKLQSYDDITFQFFTFENKYIIMTYDPKKDLDTSKGTVTDIPNAYYENMQQVLEQLKVYDENILKTWWQPIADTIELDVDMNSYNEEWYSDLLKDKYISEKENNYSILIYNDESYKPVLYSPFNTLHEVSPINVQTGTHLEKLSFEIHPISCRVKNESYLVKIAFNDEPVLKEWINYKVFKKKGLKIFLETLFNEMEQYKTK